MAVTFALLLLGLIAILGLVEVSYVFWAKRDAQKVADLAALAGVQRLDMCAPDDTDNGAARSNAMNQNHFTGGVQVACGVWDPNPASGTQPDHFYSVDSTTPQPNAVKVVATYPFVPFFGFVRAMNITASAVAKNEGPPIAAFSVGSTLASVDTGKSALLNPLLGALGTNASLDLLSYKGLAGLNVNVLDLVHVLGLNAGTVDGVLNAPVDIGNLLDATVTALQNDKGNDLADVDLGLVKQQVAALKAVLGDATVKLGDILDVNAVTSNPDTALDAGVNVGDLLGVALQAANGSNFVSASVPVNLGGLGNAQVKLALIEPPKVAVGYPRTISPPGATAHTAQTRLYANLSLLAPASQQLIPPINILGLVSSEVSTGSTGLVNLPLYLELAPATGILDDVRCFASTSPVSHQVDIRAAPGLANVFVGNLPGAFDNGSNGHSWNDLVSNATTTPKTGTANPDKDPNDVVAYADLLSLKLKLSLLFGLLSTNGDIKVQAYINVPVSSEGSGGGMLHFSVDPNTPVNQQNLVQNIGSGSDLLGQVKNGLLTPGNIHLRIDASAVNLNLLGFPINIGDLLQALLNPISGILSGVVGLLGNLLGPVLDALDQALLGPLLDLLGINPANADVALTDVQCHSGAQLVY